MKYFIGTVITLLIVISSALRIGHAPVPVVEYIPVYQNPDETVCETYDYVMRKFKLKYKNENELRRAVLMYMIAQDGECTSYKY